jgi:hypothetical protein
VADDDWRVTVTLHEDAHAGRTVQSLHEHQVEDDVRRRLGHRVAVSADGPRVFLYAGTEDAAREAERVVREVLAQHQVNGEFALDRWHPVEQDWEDASAAMPQTAEQVEAEREHRVSAETQESLAAGQAGWEVRVEMPSRRAAEELAGRLREEGHVVTRRWKYLVLGANNEDEASALAEAVRQEAPTSVSVQAGSVPFVAFGTTEIGRLPILPAN